ncbi:MAG TPA: TetR/AcrR family transcriptional regulator [Nevskiaceae bacterium]|nr:TetR/AcrR family transcriptional regulator [Nevskiaceae bacterium]
MKTPTIPRRRGRPKDPAKRSAILEAAKDLFARHGLAGTSMEAIAARAGVSKLTLYSHFATKDDLFQQAVIAKCEEHAPAALFEGKPGEPLRARLTGIAGGFLALVMNEQAMELHRMMCAQAGSDRRLGRLFFSAGPQRTIAQFARLLAAATRSGELAVPDPQRAAAHFFCLLKGADHLRVMVGAGRAPPPPQTRAHIADVVELFLRAYAPAAKRR